MGVLECLSTRARVRLMLDEPIRSQSRDRGIAVAALVENSIAHSELTFPHRSVPVLELEWRTRSLKFCYSAPLTIEGRYK
jgi:hypothetical protein